MELFVLQIQQKIIHKKQQNDLSSVIMELCGKMNIYMSSEYQKLLLLYKSQPPVYLLTSIAGLARLLKNSIDIYTGTFKDELLNYFTEWCGITQGNFETTIVSICNHRYRHNDLREAMDQVQQCSQLVLHLFRNLASLEYIGKKKEAGIFVKEQLMIPEKEEESVRKRRSFLAD